MLNPEGLVRRMPALICILTIGLLAVSAAATDPALDDLPANVVEDGDVPYGVAANWLIGHRLLMDGDPAAALPYLHMAYRTHSKEPSVALDFKQALVAGGYYRDALSVMNKLVEAWPDSLAYRVDRAALYAKNGMTDQALSDLRFVRNAGLVDLDVIAAEASLLAAEGEIDQALDVYRDGLQLFPEFGEEIYLGMAAILQQAQQTGKMAELMEEATAAHPESASLRVVYIRTLAGTGQHDEALAVARQADIDFKLAGRTQPVDPTTVDSPDAHGPVPESFLVELADFYSVHGEFDRAVGILEPLLNKGQLDLGPSLWLARLYLGRGSFEQGTALVETILARWPESGRAWFLKGSIAESEDDLDSALDFYRQAVSHAPDDPEVRLALVRTMIIAWEADLLVAGGDVADKRSELQVHAEAANNLVPEVDAQGQLVLGYAWKLLNDPDRAIDRFGLAALDPDLHMRAMIQASICQDEAGDIDAALATLRELRDHYPGDPEVANSLGYFLAEKDQDLDYAEALVQEALTVDGGNGAYLDSLGWIYYRQGRLDAALDYLIRAVNVAPDDPVILEHLAIVLYRQGQHTEAIEMLNRSLAMGGDPQRLQNLRAEIESTADEDR